MDTRSKERSVGANLMVGRRLNGQLDYVERPADFGHAEFKLEDFLHNLRYEPLGAEQEVIDKIETDVGELLDREFASADAALEEFYESVRGEEGRYDWSLLTGQDVDTLIFELQRTIASVERQTTKYFMRAQASFMSWDEEYWDAYRKPIEGTQNDRVAYARGKTRETRYFYLLQYWVWKLAADRLKSAQQLKKDLDWYLQRRCNDRSGFYGS